MRSLTKSPLVNQGQAYDLSLCHTPYRIRDKDKTFYHSIILSRAIGILQNDSISIRPNNPTPIQIQNAAHTSHINDKKNSLKAV